LLDLLGKGSNDPLVAWLRGPLEDPAVVKVIHDCRMDSDALFHLLGIKLANVHDTSCWVSATFSLSKRLNLNDTLEKYGLQVNTARDGDVYTTNKAFWVARPLTVQMIEWASGDVRDMLELQRRQIERATSTVKGKAEAASFESLAAVRTAKFAIVETRHIGRFIGKGGKALHDLELRTKTSIQRVGTAGSFRVQYQDDSSLLAVQRAASSAQTDAEHAKTRSLYGRGGGGGGSIEHSGKSHYSTRCNSDYSDDEDPRVFDSFSAAGIDYWDSGLGYD
jgi:exonuclease 3'-5' domain-containing protein 1